MAEQKRPWILNLDQIVSMTLVADDVLNAAALAALRTHCITGYGPLLRFEYVKNIYAYLRSDAIEADGRGYVPVVLSTDPQTLQMSGVEIVRDWLAEVHVHSPRHHRAILNKRMSFKQMIEAAERWHDAKRRAAERLRNRAIERDDIGAPTVLELDGEWAGWRWVWLRSDEARDAEGMAMGNCVGGGYYDNMDEHAGVFSLRDPRGEPHVTVELDGHDVQQAECRGGAGISDRFRGLVDRMAAVIGVRLLVNGDPTAEVADGAYSVGSVGSILAGDREVYHVVDSVLHRDGGPARIDVSAGIYYERGVETRRIAIHHDNWPAYYYSCRMADDLDQLSRSDSYYSVGGRFRIETRTDIDGKTIDPINLHFTGDSLGVVWTPRHVPPAINAITQEIRP